MPFKMASIFYLAMSSMQVQARDIVTHLRILMCAKQLKNKNIFFLSESVQQTILHGERHYMLHILIIMAPLHGFVDCHIYTEDQL